MLPLLATSVVLLTLLLTIFWYRQKKLPPGPWGLPFLGYLPWIDPTAPYLTFTTLAKKYGPVYGVSLGNLYTVVLSDPKDIRSVLAKDAATGRAPLFVTHGIMKGYGLICSEGELWKDQRKFAHGCLRQFGAVKSSPKKDQLEALITKEIHELIEYIKGQGNGEQKTTIDPLDGLRHHVGSVMNRLTFGKSWPMEDPVWKWLQELQEEGTKLIGVSGPLNFLPILRFVPKYRRTMDFLMEGKLQTHEFYRKLIGEVERGGNGDGDLGCVIGAFLRERAKREDLRFYTDEQFVHVLADFFGAGLDTTLTTLRWFYLYIAAHPHFQTKLHEEIDLVTNHAPASLEHQPSLPLLEAAISEAQRIRPVVPLGIPHGTLAAMEVGGYTIPKSTMVVPLQWAVHMDEKWWREPEKFNPFRFLDEEGGFVKPEGYIPFQTGKRMCVGEELARVLLFLFGAKILQTFRLSVDGSVDFTGECGINLTPKHHKITFTLRDNAM